MTRTIRPNARLLLVLYAILVPELHAQEPGALREATGKLAFVSKSRPEPEKHLVLQSRTGTTPLTFTKHLRYPKAGQRAWVRGERTKAGLHVLDIETFEHARAEDISTLSRRSGHVEVRLGEVHAWCDHMPGRDEERSQNRHLIASLTLKRTPKSTSKRAPSVTLKRAFVSFQKDDEGRLVDLSLRGKSGLGTGQKQITLKADEVPVQLRGDGVFPEDMHSKTLFLLLVFEVGGKREFVRTSCKVQVTS